MKTGPAGLLRSRRWDLFGARVALGARTSRKLDLSVEDGRIVSLRPPGGKPAAGVPCLDLRGFMVMPGLINAHDHLEFNLFPRLGRGPYPNAGAWARDIYHPERAPIREHLAVPLDTRLRWGAVKNLLSGATTVCHHNPYHRRTFGGKFPVRVPRRYGWAHSLEFCADLGERFRETPSDWPFVVHLGEAVDARGREEVWKLERLGALERRTVLVHAVAVDRAGLRAVRERGASMVWCPSSNLFLLGRTLERESLDCGIPVALGTDSALTGEAGLLDEIRCAAGTGQVSIERLYAMVTSEAARVMRLRDGEGSVVEGGVADLVITEDAGGNPGSSLLELTTERLDLVFVRGEIRLASARAASRLPERARRPLHPLHLENGSAGPGIYVAANLPRLFAGVEPIFDVVFLAHRKVSRAA